MAEQTKIKKQQFSDVQKLSEGKKNTIKKWFWIILSIVVITAFVVIGLSMFSQYKKGKKKAKEVASTTKTPYTASKEKILGKDDLFIGQNYIIYTSPTGKVKVTSTGEITYVDENGQYNGGVSDVLKSQIAKEVSEMERNNSSIANALGGFDANKFDFSSDNSETARQNANNSNISERNTNIPNVDLTTDSGKALQKALEDKNWTIDGFSNSFEDYLDSQNLTWEDVENIAKTLGISTEELLKDIVDSKDRAKTFESLKAEAQKQGYVPTNQGRTQVSGDANILPKTSDNKSKNISIEVAKVGNSAQKETTADGNSASPSSNATWLDTASSGYPVNSDKATNMVNDSMTALVNTLSSINGVSPVTTNSQEKENWMEAQQSNAKIQTGRLTKWDLAAGTVVPITIYTGINTDLPGNVVGLVRQDVYDTLTGSNLIIPKGSRLIANYNSSVSFGQKSLQIAWNNLITPDGYTFTLPGFQTVDGEGYSGLKGDVNNHYGQLFIATAFGTVIDYGAEILAAMAGTRINSNVKREEAATFLEYLLNGQVDAVQSVGQQYVQKAINQEPTIKIKSGTLTQLLVNQTITLKRGE